MAVKKGGHYGLVDKTLAIQLRSVLNLQKN